MSRRLFVLWNVTKAWLLLIGLCAIFGAIGWGLGDYRLLSVFIFCALLFAGAVYWYADRVALGMVGARELPTGERPALHSTVERLAVLAAIDKPRLYVIPDGFPRALAVGRGP